MKKLFSTSYNNSAFNLALFVLRVGSGILMIHRGYGKLIHFNDIAPRFMHFLGMSGSLSLSLVIFAEFFCSILLMLGLFTRLACIPLIIDLSVAVARMHKYDIFGKGESTTLFAIIFLTILIVGPGRVSVDGMISK